MLSWELKCPHCGGPNEVGADRNCLTCHFCGAGLWVKLPDGYPTLVAPRRITCREAVYAWDRHLKEAGEPLSHSPRQQNCVYLPFWRISAIIAVPRLERRVRPTAEAPYSESEYNPLAHFANDPTDTNEQVEWEIKPWDMSIPAFDSEEWGLATLGIRVETVPLTGWERVEMDPDDVCYPVSVSEASAQGRIRKTVDAIIAQGTHKPLGECHLITPKLSLIYWPVWRLAEQRGENGRIVEVDGVSGKVIRTFAGRREFQSVEGNTISGESPALMPHRCLSCGQDLPVNDRFVVFLCANCHALISHESNGKRQVITAEFTGAENPLQQHWYPFWAFQGGDLLIPAFAIRNYRLLVRFSEIMSGQQRAFGDPPEETHRLKGIVGAALPVDVAAGLARVVLERNMWQGIRAQMDHGRNPTAQSSLSTPRLVYAPLEESGTELVDPVTGLCLSRSALAPA